MHPSKVGVVVCKGIGRDSDTAERIRYKRGASRRLLESRRYQVRDLLFVGRFFPDDLVKQF